MGTILLLVSLAMLLVLYMWLGLAPLRALRIAADEGVPLSAQVEKLHRYSGLAIEVLGSEAVRRPSLAELPSVDGRAVDVALRFAQLAAERYGITIPTITVRIARLAGDRPAQITRERHGWLLEVHDHWIGDNHRLASVVAHEVAHIALHQAAVELVPTKANEELTDAVAVWGGFGRVMLKGYYRESYSNGVGVETHGFERAGYLTPSAIAYLTLLRTMLEHDAWRPTRVRLNGWDGRPYRLLNAQLRGRPRSCTLPVTSDPVWECFVCRKRHAWPTVQGTIKLSCRRCGWEELVALHERPSEA